jgi:Pentapeptide repeats (8 copies)
LNTAVIGAISGAVFGLIGVLVGQYLTQRRHTEALRQTAELEEQRAHQAALLKYFELGGQLIRVPADADYLGPILRAQTLTLLEALEPGHKRILLQFLYESNLLGPEKPGFSLRGANLERANLAVANLKEANLKETNLSGALLQGITKESLTQTQINEAVGNDATKLPDHLQRPAHWRGGLEGRG